MVTLAAPVAETHTADPDTNPDPAQPNRLSPSASVARGAMALLSTQPLTWMATLLVTVMAPHYLGDRGLGQYAVAMNIAALAGLAASLGVPDYVRRRVSTHPARAATEGGAALVLLIAVTLTVGAALSVILPLFASSIAAPAVFRFAMVGMVMGGAQAVLFALLIGQERHARYAWLNAANVVLGSLAGVGVLVAGGGVAAYTAAGAVTLALLAALGWRLSGYKVGRAAFSFALWRRLIAGGLVFLGWNAAIQVRNQIDVVLVAALLGAQGAGWLSAAYRITTIPFFIPNLITTPLSPALYRCADDRAVFAQTLRRSVVAVVLLMVPASAFTIAAAPLVPELLHWGAAFHHSVPLIQIIALEQPIMAVDMVLGAGLFALRLERGWLRVALMGAAFNPLVNLLMIPFFERRLGNGAVGAAGVEIVTELVMLSGALSLMPAGIIDRSTISTSVRIVVAGVCLGVVTALLRPTSLPSLALAGTAGVAIFLAVALCLRVIRLADLRHVRTIGTQMLARKLARGA